MGSTGDVSPYNSGSLDVTTLDPTVVARHTSELLERNKWSRQQLQTFQEARIKETLRHAANSSGFRRERIDSLVASNPPLEDYPVMNKTILMAELDRILTDHRLNRSTIEHHVASDRAGLLLFDEYRVVATGGFSGQRGLFVYDQLAWELAVANVRRLQRLLGLPPDAKALGIGAPSAVHLTYRFNGEQRVNRPGAPCLSVITPMSEVVSALNEYQPDILSTYPSFIRRLAEEQLAGRLRIAPLAIRSVAEALSPDVKKLAWATWKTRVTNN